MRDKEVMAEVAQAFYEFSVRLDKRAQAASSDYDERILGKVAREAKRLAVDYRRRSR